MTRACNTGNAPLSTLRRPYSPRGSHTTATYRGYHLTITNQHIQVRRPDGTLIDTAASISSARRTIRYDRKALR